MWVYVDHTRVLYTHNLLLLTSLAGVVQLLNDRRRLKTTQVVGALITHTVLKHFTPEFQDSRFCYGPIQRDKKILLVCVHVLCRFVIPPLVCTSFVSQCSYPTTPSVQTDFEFVISFLVLWLGGCRS